MRAVGQEGVYRIPAEHHAEGGQARVYRVEQDGQVVAVKIARRRGEAGAWMDRERDVLRELLEAHPDLEPWVVPIIDHGVTEEGRRFLVMPWFDQSLEEWQAGRSLEERLLGMERAAEAVTRLHSFSTFRQGVVHRDIKPSNFLIRGSGDALQVVLSDFGGVKRLESWSSSLNSGMHTRGFAPPDQILPRRIPPDQSWDIYALGVTLFWSIAQKLPTASQQAGHMFTQKGWEILSLYQSENLPPATKEELLELSGRPLSELIRFSEMVPLTRMDRELLRHSIVEAMGERHVEEAEESVRGLGELLEEALQPDPSNRGATARQLQSLTRRLRKHLMRTSRAGSALPPPPPPSGESVKGWGADWRPKEAPASPSGEAVRRVPHPPPEPLSETLVLTASEASEGVLKTLTCARQVRCVACQGAGCPDCNEQGLTEVATRYRLRIPAGARDGAVLTLKGRGHDARDPAQPPGDVRLSIQVTPLPPKAPAAPQIPARPAPFSPGMPLSEHYTVEGLVRVVEGRMLYLVNDDRPDRPRRFCWECGSDETPRAQTACTACRADLSPRRFLLSARWEPESFEPLRRFFESVRSHPAIAGPVDVFEEGAVLCVVTPWSGEGLLVDESAPLPFETLFHFAQRTAGLIAFLHLHGVRLRTLTTAHFLRSVEWQMILFDPDILAVESASVPEALRGHEIKLLGRCLSGMVGVEETALSALFSAAGRGEHPSPIHFGRALEVLYDRIRPTEPPVQVAAMSDVGLVKAHNADAWGWRCLTSQIMMLAVSDGADGEAESGRLAVETLLMMASQRPGRGDGVDGALVEGLRAAARGTDMVAALFEDGRDACIASIGSARAYLLRDSRLQVIPDAHPVEQKVRVTRVPVLAKDILLLCTDGLWSAVSDADIQAILGHYTDLRSACRELVRAAHHGGGRDNVTVLLARIPG